jgi:hypothetical protein
MALLDFVHGVVKVPESCWHNDNYEPIPGLARVVLLSIEHGLSLEASCVRDKALDT